MLETTLKWFSIAAVILGVFTILGLGALALIYIREKKK